MNRLLTTALVALCLPAAAGAATLSECGDYRTDLRSIAEPWEDHTRIYANGEIRVVLIDTIEPAAGAFHLVLLTPPYDELGSPVCTVVSPPEGSGFSGISFPDMVAEEAAGSLKLTVPVGLYDATTDTFPEAVLTVTVDTAAGTLTAEVK